MSAVHAGVAELEALVDEREVGQEVARRGVRDRGPVRVRAGAQADAADAVAVALDDARRSRRAGSRRGRRRSAALADRGTAAAGRTGPSSRRVEEVEARKQLERALLESGLDVARRRGGAPRLEAVVGKAGARRADVLGDARRAGGGADDAERGRRRGVDDRRCRASGP